MQFITTKENLGQAANIVQRAVSPQTPVPILACLFLEATSNTLQVTATDLDFGISTVLPITTVSEGAVALPARYVTNLLNKLPNLDINITTDLATNSTTFAYGENSEMVLNGYPAEEFPKFPDLPEQPVLKIKQNVFKNMLKKVLFAVDHDERRPIFTGLSISINETGELVMVGTDTRKLAVCKEHLDQPPDKTISMIVPGKNLNELYKILEDVDDYFYLYLSENRIFFVLDKIKVMSRLIAGQYPDYRIVVPDHFQCEIKARVSALLETAERASLLIDAKRNVFSVNFHSQGLTTYFYTESGRIREELRADFTGEPIDVGFNVRLFIDLLKAIDTEEVIIKLSGRKTPALFLPVGQEDYFSLLVPAVAG